MKDHLVFGLSVDVEGKWLATSVGMPFSRVGPSDIWMFKADGSSAKNLTQGLGGKNVFPSFSRDNQMVVFSHSKDGLTQHLYLLNRDTLDIKQLTDGPVLDTMCKFSPVNNDIAFVRRKVAVDNDNQLNNFETFMLRLDAYYNTIELSPITEGIEGAHTHPAFSSDGQKIIFSSEAGGYNDEPSLISIFNPQSYGDIWIKDIASQQLFRITDNVWEDGLASWFERSALKEEL